MFVLATMYAGSGSASVKIRNLSSTGALIEGGVIPLQGTKFNLARGSLRVSGEIMWRNAGRAGVKFDASILVADWLPKGLTTSHQGRVDAMMQQVSAATVTPVQSIELRASPATAIEITQVKTLLEALAEDLADDNELVARLGSKLQVLDLAAQLLGKLATEPTREHFLLPDEQGRS